MLTEAVCASKHEHSDGTLTEGDDMGAGVVEGTYPVPAKAVVSPRAASAAMVVVAWCMMMVWAGKLPAFAEAVNANPAGGRRPSKRLDAVRIVL